MNTNSDDLIFDIPTVTAKSWAAFNGSTNEFIFGKKPYQQVEIASLTKILTCFVTIKFFEKHQLDPQRLKITISKAAE